ncbi:zinc-ribbon domain-containing protein [Pseudomonas silvicola]|nr:zinc-ribbon domain-containing protein [Pseudomonas silvicola]
MKGIFCTTCGTENLADANFCFNCGQSIVGKPAEVEIPPTPFSGQLSALGRELGHKTAEPAATSTSVRKGRRYNFVAKHWHGEYSLAVSYWLFGCLVSVVSALLSAAFGNFNDALDLGTEQQGAMIVIFYIAVMALSVWQIVGVIRSASAHVSRGGKQFWAVAAKVMVCIGAIRLVMSFTLDGIPLIREGITMVRGNDNIPPYSLRLMRNDTELELAGGIPIGTTSAVRRILDSSPKVRVIHLNSTGGRIAEATKLADLISQRQLITYTRTTCSSACALAFLAGRERYISEQGRIGFHSASIHGATGSDALDVNASFKGALVRAGATPQFVAKATSVSPQSLWFPTALELKEQNIITSVVDSRYFGLSGISDWRDANIIEQALLKTPVYMALSLYDSGNYLTLRKTVVEGVQAGRSAAEIQTDLQKLLTESFVPGYLNRGPDQALIRYWRSQIAEIKYFGRTNPSQCVTFLGLDAKASTLDLMKGMPSELANEDLAALADLIKQSGTNPVKALPFSEYDKEFKGVLVTMMSKDRGSVEIIANPEKFANDPARTCQSMIALYDAILSLSDQKKAAGMLRSMSQESKR